MEENVARQKKKAENEDLEYPKSVVCKTGRTSKNAVKKRLEK